jgi:DNA/RNA-binding domain of Phe-tRNA-synthetase-like protein
MFVEDVAKLDQEIGGAFEDFGDRDGKLIYRDDFGNHGYCVEWENCENYRVLKKPR